MDRPDCSFCHGTGLCRNGCSRPPNMVHFSDAEEYCFECEQNPGYCRFCHGTGKMTGG